MEFEFTTPAIIVDDHHPNTVQNFLDRNFGEDVYTVKSRPTGGVTIINDSGMEHACNSDVIFKLGERIMIVSGSENKKDAFPQFRDHF
jgi:hypothetical protein